MKKILLSLIASTCLVGTLHAQFSRLYVKSPVGSTIGLSTGTATSNKVIGFDHDGTAGIISATTLNGSPDYSPLRFVTSGQTRMVIFENGFVGIGTTGTPSAELTVGGKIHAREVKVRVDAGADYVFEDSYKLPPLTEVMAYIKVNKHLPEIPSAAEMENDGVELGELNIKLLKKVEELTLYVINQQTAIDELQKQLIAQQQLINELQNQKK